MSQSGLARPRGRYRGRGFPHWVSLFSAGFVPPDIPHSCPRWRQASTPTFSPPCHESDKLYPLFFLHSLSCVAVPPRWGVCVVCLSIRPARRRHHRAEDIESKKESRLSLLCPEVALHLLGILLVVDAPARRMRRTLFH